MEQEKEETQKEKRVRRIRMIAEFKAKHSLHDYDCEGCAMLYIIGELQKEECKIPHPYIKPDNDGIRWCPKCGQNATPFNEEM